MAKYCLKCNDTGEIPRSERLSIYASSKKSFEYVVCPTCKGSSREKLRELEEKVQNSESVLNQ